MSVEERLARLNAKTQSFTDTGGGFGGMTVLDLCAAMSGISKTGELIIRRKYVDPKDKGEGYYRLLSESVARIYDAGKQPKKKNMIQPLLDIALDDYCGNNLCKSCNGTGEVLSAGVIRKCRARACVDGRTAMKDCDKAKLLGVGAMDFRRNYRDAYGIIERYLVNILPNEESEALSTIRKQAKWTD